MENPRIYWSVDMESLPLADNPFKVFTPEDIGAEDMHDLFVPVPDFNKIRDPGHRCLTVRGAVAKA